MATIHRDAPASPEWHCRTLAQPHGFDDEPNILFIFPQITECNPTPPAHHLPPTPTNKIWEKARRSARCRRGIGVSVCSGRYLDRTWRHGGNEAFYTSWLWNKKWCFDCIVRALSGGLGSWLRRGTSPVSAIACVLEGETSSRHLSLTVLQSGWVRFSFLSFFFNKGNSWGIIIVPQCIAKSFLFLTSVTPTFLLWYVKCRNARMKIT